MCVVLFQIRMLTLSLLVSAVLAFTAAAVSIYILALNWLLTVKVWCIVTWVCAAVSQILWMRVIVLCLESGPRPAHDPYSRFSTLGKLKWLVVAILWTCLLTTLPQEQIDWLDSHSFITGPQPRHVTLDTRSDNLRAYIFYMSIWTVTLILSVNELSEGFCASGEASVGRNSVSAPAFSPPMVPDAAASDLPVVVVVKHPSAPSYATQNLV